MPKVSVIIPIYNCERFLKHSLESVLKQTEKSIEILLVDDGSTDSSLDICKYYSNLDNRITIIQQKNGGVSSARNTGIRKATGDYITFLDADDYMDISALEIAYEEVVKSDADIGIWNYYLVEKESIIKNLDFPGQGTYDNGNGAIDGLIATTLCPKITSLATPNNLFIGMSFVWNKIFKTSLIKDNRILFNESVMLNEDVVFVCECLKKARLVNIIDRSLYYYRVVEDGATLRYKPEIARNNIKLFEALDKVIVNPTITQKDALNCRVVRSLANLVKFYYFHTKYKGNRIRNLKRAVKSDQHYATALQSVNLKYLTYKQAAIVVIIRLLLLY